MNWWRFLFWNASGGIVWATAVGLASYFAGQAAADAFQRYGLYAAGVIAAIVLGAVAVHVAKRRLESNV